MSDWIDVAPQQDFADGEYHVVEVEGVLIAVFRLGDEYYAIEDVCPHDYECLTGGEVAGEVIVCPRHGAKFSIKTGAVLAPPAYEGIVTFPVQAVGGMVQVRDPRWD